MLSNSRPDSVILHIYGSDGSENTYTITGDNTQNTSINSWDYSETLPKYDKDGEIITYTVSQDKAISKEDGIEYLEPVVNGFDITNIADISDPVHDGTKVSVVINWNDDDNTYGFRPKTVTVNLLQNDIIIKTVEILTTDNNYTFTDLPIYDENFDAYEYTLTSNEVDRYTKVIDNKTYTITYGFQKPVFSIVIPKTVILDGETGIGEYKVTVKGIIDNRDNITVIPERSFILRNDYLSDVIATVKQSKNTFTNADDLLNGTFASGTINSDTLAGKWTGDFNFKIKFNFGS